MFRRLGTTRTITALLVATMMVASPTAVAQDADHEPAPSIALIVATADPEGTQSLFGHSYLVVQRPGQAKEIAYTYQIFKPEQDWSGLPSASIGRAVMDLERLNATFLQQSYVDQGREIRRTPLLLEPDEAWDLADTLRAASDDEGVIPYHMIEENCSTRLRDFIDDALGGRLAEATADPTGRSVRSLAIPYIMHQATNAQVWLFLYGSSGDRELTAWQKTFIPAELERVLRDARVEGDDGPRAIAGATNVDVAGALQPPETTLGPDAVKAVTAAALVGLAVAGVFAVRLRPVASNRAIGVGLATVGLLMGLVSTFILFAWTGGFGSHLSHNQNILIASPLGWSLIPLGITIWNAPQRTWRVLFGVGAVSLLLLVVAVFIRFLPGVPAQDNLPAIGVAGVFWGGLVATSIWGADARPLTHTVGRVQAWLGRLRLGA